MWERLAAAVLVALALSQPGIAQKQKQCGKVVYIVVDPETAEKLSELGGVVPDDYDHYAVGFGKIPAPIIAKITKPGFSWKDTDDPEKLKRLIKQVLKRPCQDKKCEPSKKICKPPSPPGQKPCDGAKIRINGKCVKPDKKCDPSKKSCAPPSPPGQKPCDGAKIRINGKCVKPEKVCRPGKPKPCEEPNKVCKPPKKLVGDKCKEGDQVTCPETFLSVAGKCLPSFPCPPGLVKTKGGDCVIGVPCPPGFVSVPKSPICVPAPPKPQPGECKDKKLIKIVGICQTPKICNKKNKKACTDVPNPNKRCPAPGKWNGRVCENGKNPPYCTPDTELFGDTCLPVVPCFPKPGTKKCVVCEKNCQSKGCPANYKKTGQLCIPPNPPGSCNKLGEIKIVDKCQPAKVCKPKNKGPCIEMPDPNKKCQAPAKWNGKTCSSGPGKKECTEDTELFGDVCLPVLECKKSKKCVVCEKSCQEKGCPDKYKRNGRLCKPPVPRLCSSPGEIMVAGKCQPPSVCDGKNKKACVPIPPPLKFCTPPSIWNGKTCITKGKPRCSKPYRLFGTLCRPMIPCNEQTCVLCEAECEDNGCPKSYKREGINCYPGPSPPSSGCKEGEVKVVGVCQPTTVCPKNKDKCEKIEVPEEKCSEPDGKWNGKVCNENGKPVCKAPLKMFGKICRPTVKCGEGLECVICEKNCKSTSCPKGYKKQDHLCFPPTPKPPPGECKDKKLIKIVGICQTPQVCDGKGKKACTKVPNPNKKCKAPKKWNGKFCEDGKKPPTCTPETELFGDNCLPVITCFKKPGIKKCVVCEKNCQSKGCPAGYSKKRQLCIPPNPPGGCKLETEVLIVGKCQPAKVCDPKNKKSCTDIPDPNKRCDKPGKWNGKTCSRGPGKAKCTPETELFGKVCLPVLPCLKKAGAKKCVVCEENCQKKGCPQDYKKKGQLCEPPAPKLCTKPGEIMVAGKCQPPKVCDPDNKKACAPIPSPPAFCKPPAEWNGKTCVTGGKPKCNKPYKLFGDTCRPLVPCNKQSCVLCEANCLEVGCPKPYNRREGVNCYRGPSPPSSGCKEGEVKVVGLCQPVTVCPKNKKDPCEKIEVPEDKCSLPVGKWNGKVCNEGGKPVCKAPFKMFNGVCRPTVDCGEGLTCLICEKDCQTNGCLKGYKKQDHLCYPPTPKPPPGECKDKKHIKIVGICQPPKICGGKGKTKCIDVPNPNKKCKAPGKWNGKFCENGKNPPLCTSQTKLFGDNCLPVLPCLPKPGTAKCVVCESNCLQKGCPADYIKKDNLCIPPNPPGSCNDAGKIKIVGRCQPAKVCDPKNKKACTKMPDPEKKCKAPAKWNGKTCSSGTGKEDCTSKTQMFGDSCLPVVSCGKSKKCVVCEENCQENGCPDGYKSNGRLCEPPTPPPRPCPGDSVRAGDKCLQKPSCGPDAVRVKGKCVVKPNCPSGTKLLGPNCLPKESQCAKGTKPAGGRCVPSVNPPKCPDGTNKNKSGKCIPTVTGTCPAPLIFFEGGCYGLECAAGLVLFDGECYAPQCWVGYVLKGEKCVPSPQFKCDSPAQLKDGLCLTPDIKPSCQPGWLDVEGMCYLPVPPTCAVGKVNKNGNCLPTPKIVCPGGAELTANRKSCKQGPNFVCEEGMTLFGDTCVVPWTCAWWEDVECFVSPSGECPDDFTASGPYCMKPAPPGPPIPVPPACASGRVKNKKRRCVFPPTLSCPKGKKRGDVCIVKGKPTCAKSFKLIDNTCYPEWSCESWYGGPCILTPTGTCPSGTTKAGLFCLYPPPKPACPPGSEPSSDNKYCIRRFVPGAKCAKGYKKLEIKGKTFCAMIAPLPGLIVKPQCSEGQKLSDDGLFCFKPIKVGVKCQEGYKLLKINGKKMCAKAAPIPSFVAKPECKADETLSPDGTFCFKPFNIEAGCSGGRVLIEINGQKFCGKAAPIPHATCDPGFTPSPDGKLCMMPFQLGVECSKGFKMMEINGQKFCAKAAPKCAPGQQLSTNKKHCYMKKKADGKCPNGYLVQGAYCFGVALGEEGKCKRGEEPQKNYCMWYIQLGAECPAGYTMSEDKTMCFYKIPGSGYGVECPAGTTLSDNQMMCEQSLNAKGKCPAGWWVSDDKTHCFKMMVKLQCQQKGYVPTKDGRTCRAGGAGACEPHQVFEKGQCVTYGKFSAKCDVFASLSSDDSYCMAKLKADGNCAAGYKKNGQDPVPCRKFLLAPLGCKLGEERNEDWCYHSLNGKAKCSSGYVLSQGDCFIKADKSASCPDGTKLKGNFCVKPVKLVDQSGGKCVAGAMLSKDKTRCIIKAEGGATCPKGYDKSDGWCIKIIAAAKGCEMGDKLSEDQLFCLRTLSGSSATCPKGYKKSGKKTCYKRVAGGSTGQGGGTLRCGEGAKLEGNKCIPTSQEGCPANTVYQNNNCYSKAGTGVKQVAGCGQGDRLQESNGQKLCIRALVGAKCPDGYKILQKKYCYKLAVGGGASSGTEVYQTGQVRCGKGQKLVDGNKCIPTSQEGCPKNTVYANNQCYTAGAAQTTGTQTSSQAADQTGGKCDKGYILSGDNCMKEVAEGQKCDKGYSRSGIYCFKSIVAPPGCKVGEMLSTDKKWCIQHVAEKAKCPDGYNKQGTMCFTAVAKT